MMSKSLTARIVFFLCFAALGCAVLRLLLPFAAPILWAAVLASACAPLYTWLTRSFGGRRRLAATVACAIIVGVIVVPVLLFSIMVARESVDAYDALERAISATEFTSALRMPEGSFVDTVLDAVRRFADVPRLDPESLLLAFLGRVSTFLVDNSRAILAGLTGFLFSFLTMVVTLYFFFLDGPRLLDMVRSLSPLPPEHEDALLAQFKAVSIGTLRGSLVTAAAQGLAGGLTFLVLGLSSPLLWGAVMAVAALIPLVGPAVIWLPVAVYLLMTGATIKGVWLLMIGAGLISTIDNVLRPWLIGGQMRLHLLLVFFSIIGGVRVFGLLGIVLGPLLVALFHTFLTLYRQEFAQGARLSGPLTTPAPAEDK